MRHITIVTGSRAEYGLLRFLIKELKTRSHVTVSLIATGTHLSQKFGYTIDEILDDGNEVSGIIDIDVDSSCALAISKTMSEIQNRFSELIPTLKPDIVVILGDRYEILPVAISCLIAGIPIAHIHGGEVTEAAFDEAIRHSITKMSHLHFAAAPEYRNRIIQLGEDPNRVFCVGGMGVDCIKHTALLSEPDLQKSLGIDFQDKRIMVTYHPETADAQENIQSVHELLTAIASFPDVTFLFTGANSDTDGERINHLLIDYCEKSINCHFFQSLGRVRYLSCLSHFDAVIGNSSSGLLEAPTFKIGTVNIGDRQKGRLRASSVINCEANAENIRDSLQTVLSASFQESLKSVVNPYGSGGASSAIADILCSTPLTGILRKRFFDIPKISDNLIPHY